MFYPRLIYPQLKAHLRQKEATVITGMRRTGKTSLLKALYEDLKDENKVFIDLESRISRELFQLDDYEEIWANLLQKYGLNQKKRTFLFLDEIQYLPNLPSVIKYLLDHYQAKFIVTGSSSFYLKNLFSESLSGRKQIFELFPLTFVEFLVFKNKLKVLPEGEWSLARIRKSGWWQKAYNSYYEEYLKWGGFPQVVLTDKPDQKIIALKDILYSYIEQDVKNISSFKKIDEVENLIKLLAERIGQKLDIAKISRETSLARQTILEYLGFLEHTYVISLVKPFSKSIDREIAKTPKIYFCDTGLVGILAQVSSGQALENAVFQTLRIKHQPKSIFPIINYYQKKSGAEIDFILDKKIALEVKETASDLDYKRLSVIARELKMEKCFLISKKATKNLLVVYASQL